MSDKSDDESVLGSLPATRPTRFGRERREGGGTATKTVAKPRAKKAAKKAAAAKPAPARKPRPVRAGAPALRESTERARTAEPSPPESKTTPPSGTELVTTAIQAAGELAQIGLAVGGQVLRRAVDKLPKP
jgi:hypothetical protein